jgi:sporulation-control protein spo0M
LLKVEIVEDEISRKSKGFALELVFMSTHGYYRLRLAETLIVGSENEEMLKSIKAKIDAFAKLKQNPFADGKLPGSKEGKKKK